MLYNNIKELSRQEDVYVDVCGIAGDFCVLETLKGLCQIMGNDHISVFIKYSSSC